ncbi:MAG: hypothetical protein JSV59_09820 [Flavobacteriaceae bacterium]|nr:MAG: hypothetical protein JSV59_09820 [Flavobacteriaceae bacterium]
MAAIVQTTDFITVAEKITFSLQNCIYNMLVSINSLVSCVVSQIIFDKELKGFK